MSKRNSRPFAHRRPALLALVGALLLASALWVAGAPASDLQSKLDQKKSQLAHTKERAGVLSTTIQHVGDRLDQLRGQVASLRNQQATVQEQLASAKAELKRDKARLVLFRARLKRALSVLRQRLVEIYESDQPDAMTVILDSKGFDDMLNRYEYLRRVQNQDTSIAGRVRGLETRPRTRSIACGASVTRSPPRRRSSSACRPTLQARQGDLIDARGSEPAAPVEGPGQPAAARG